MVLSTGTGSDSDGRSIVISSGASASVSSGGFRSSAAEDSATALPVNLKVKSIRLYVVVWVLQQQQVARGKESMPYFRHRILNRFHLQIH